VHDEIRWQPEVACDILRAFSVGDILITKLIRRAQELSGENVGLDLFALPRE